MRKPSLIAAVILAAASSAFAGVSVSSPAAGSTVGSPVHFVASASGSSTISAMKVYVDGNTAYKTYSSSINTYLSMGTGTHSVVTNAWDNSGNLYQDKRTITVGSTSTTTSSSTASTSLSIGGTGVTITSPGNGSSSGSPVHVVASAVPSGGSPISSMKLYVDGNGNYLTYSNHMDKYVSMGTGTHKLVINSWDTSGRVYSSSTTVSVGSGTTTTAASSTSTTTSSTSSSSTSTSTGTTISDIDQRSGWFSCTTCAGANASGPTASYWMKTGVSSPSMDGKAAEFHLGGSTPYSDALWAQTLVSDKTTARSIHHVISDIYFYYTNAHAAQAFEFNISHYADGVGYIYGVQCNIRSGSGPHWDISVPNNYSKPLTLTNMKWQSTGISCVPPTYKWNHVQLEFYRTSTNKVTFVSITFNGDKHYINVTVPPRIAPSDWTGMNTHFQIDGNYQQEAYSAWVDRWSVTYW